MKNKKKFAAIIFVLIVLFLATFLVLNNRNSGDLSGKVIGPNPSNIPENKLPVCNFDGTRFVEEPCYSPPDAGYF